MKKRIFECLKNTDLYTESSLLAAKTITEARLNDISRSNPLNVVTRRLKSHKPITMYRGIKFLSCEEETIGESTERHVLDFLSYANSFLPERDIPTEIYTQETMDREYLIPIFDKILPKAPISFIDLERLCFYGLGQYYMVKVDNCYSIDLSFLSKYDVRAGYEKYGGKIQFNEYRQIVKITFPNGDEYSDEAMDEHMARFENIFKCSLFTAITLKEHLVNTHWIVANNVTVESLLCLKHNNPLLLFLRPYTYGTVAINNLSMETLAPFDGIAGRAWGFTRSSWNELLTDVFSIYETETVYERAMKNNSVNLPLFYQGIEFYDIIRRHVSEFYSIFSDIHLDSDVLLFFTELMKHKLIHNLDKESQINCLTHFIFTVTAYHNYFGGISEYLKPVDGLHGKAPLNSTSADVNTYLLDLTLCSMTSSPNPKLMHNWSFVFENGQMDIECLRFLSDLCIFSIKIKNSDVPFYFLDPDTMNSSVSI